MSDANRISGLSRSRFSRERVAMGCCTVILFLALVRAPVAVDAEPAVTYQTLLYESLRLGQTWGEQIITTDGPLGALLAPGYVRNSVWMAMAWQIAGNLLLAGLFVGAAFRLPRPRRWWALAFLASILAGVPPAASWLAMVLLGHELVRERPRVSFMDFSLAGILGFLALTSLGHLLLGTLALLLFLFTHRPAKSKIVAVGAFGLAAVAGWLVLGQPLTGLSHWLFRAMPALWQTSELLHVTDIAPLGFWAGAVTISLVIVLVVRCRHAANHWRDFFPTGTFLLGAAWLAWKTIALQPYGTTEIFFSTVLLSGFILLHRSSRLGWIGLIVATSLSGLIRGNPMLFTDAVGRLNRQIVASVRMLATLPRLRENLRVEVEAHRAPYALPRIKAAVGDATVDVLGTSPSRAILNGLKLVRRPTPLDPLIRTAALAVLNGASLESNDAPAFVIQSIQSPHDLAPGLLDAPAQLALYRHYDLQFEDNGLMLWRKKSAPVPEIRKLVASGELAYGEHLRLPSTGGALWLELDIAPSLIGRVQAAIDDVAEPGLLVRDASGVELRYPILPAVANAGFLVEPFIRGGVDFIRRESGEIRPPTTEIAVVAPVHGAWSWTQRYRYRLYEIPGLSLRSSILPVETLQVYRLLNRLPVGATATYPLSVLPSDQGGLIFFAHPSSIVEFAVTGKDRQVRGYFGLQAGAYRGVNATDGVDFSIDFLGNDGARQTLYHRWLDPVTEPRDRGRQEFAVNLPHSDSGRLFLRTYNPSGRNASWDWAFWDKIIIE